MLHGGNNNDHSASTYRADCELDGTGEEACEGAKIRLVWKLSTDCICRLTVVQLAELSHLRFSHPHT